MTTDSFSILLLSLYFKLLVGHAPTIEVISKPTIPLTHSNYLKSQGHAMLQTILAAEIQGSVGLTVLVNH